MYTLISILLNIVRVLMKAFKLLLNENCLLFPNCQVNTIGEEVPWRLPFYNIHQLHYATKYKKLNTPE